MSDTPVEPDLPEDEPEPEAPEEEPPAPESFAISTKEADYIGRLLITPGTDCKDFLGRATTATADHLGRLLVDV